MSDVKTVSVLSFCTVLKPQGVMGSGVSMFLLGCGYVNIVSYHRLQVWGSADTMHGLMKLSLKKTPAQKARRREFTMSNLLLDFADTTWRIAVPVVIFTMLGIFIDKRFETKPWATLLGSLIGFGFAALLVKRQLDASKEDEDNV